MAPVGTVHTAWVANEVSADGTHSVAHTKSYIKVLIPYDESLKGAKIRVRITKTDKFHVEADIEHVYFKHRGFDAAGATVVDPNEARLVEEKKKESKRSTPDASATCTSENCCGGTGDSCGVPEEANVALEKEAAQPKPKVLEVDPAFQDIDRSPLLLLAAVLCALMAVLFQLMD